MNFLNLAKTNIISGMAGFAAWRVEGPRSETQPDPSPHAIHGPDA